MSDPYLILHKVRGQPAFDIATKIQIGEEEGWVIPTSGHRAYPWWSIELTNIDDTVELDPSSPYCDYKPMPPDWPDHYPKPVPEPFKPSLIQQLGLVRQPPRRI